MSESNEAEGGAAAPLSAEQLAIVRKYHEWTRGTICNCGEDPCTEGQLLATVDVLTEENASLARENRALLGDDVMYAQTSRGQLLIKMRGLEAEASRLRTAGEKMRRTAWRMQAKGASSKASVDAFRTAEKEWRVALNGPAQPSEMTK